LDLLYSTPNESCLIDDGLVEWMCRLLRSLCPCLCPRARRRWLDAGGGRSSRRDQGAIQRPDKSVSEGWARRNTSPPCPALAVSTLSFGRQSQPDPIFVHFFLTNRIYHWRRDFKYVPPGGLVIEGWSNEWFRGDSNAPQSHQVPPHTIIFTNLIHLFCISTQVTSSHAEIKKG
jgi:hypothetical protein